MVATGVPGNGKSTLINEICGRAAERHGLRTVFASFEQVAQTDHRRALRTFHVRKLEKFMTAEEIAEADAWIRQHFGFVVPSAAFGANSPTTQTSPTLLRSPVRLGLGPSMLGVKSPVTGSSEPTNARSYACSTWDS